ncbi:hypothetical protein GCM10027270_35100 [Nocardioides ginkgobilobae]
MTSPRVLLYADLRTNHALAWLEGLRSADIDVLPVSSQIVDSDVPFARDPVAAARAALVRRKLNRKVRSTFVPAGEVPSGDPSMTTDGRDLVQILETSITPLRLPAQMQLLRRQIDRYEPDVVHALRVPYEGLIALQASSQTPVALSCWGQDFSRQAGRDPLLARWVKRSLPRAAGLHVDAKVDLQRAREYGWSADRPTLHAAGNFGVRSDRVFEIERSGPLKIVYPRGRRQYIRHELFLGMITAFASDPRFEFHGVGLAGDPATEALAQRVGSDRLKVYPELDSPSYLAILRQADLVVSPSLSDGTPNSLLEALVSGASILATDIPSVRELLRHDPRSRLISADDSAAWSSSLRDMAPALERRRREPVRLSRLPEEHNAEANKARVRTFYEEVISWSRAGR